MASPAVMGFFTRNSLMSSGAAMLPKMPVISTATTVMGPMPPWAWDTLMAMGVVTDLGRRDAVMAASSPNRRQSRRMLPMEDAEPTTHPTRMGSQFSFRIRIFP
ncbi:Uncharacterised protein [Flavonifractor plautii]|uniref:Uncharacterized protein n=1 Tax=Flavonifractor plautii TaxID=292800 RepID=A0A174M8R5_FLAPL|nr:Uncharacterised protein [Flavonifractor plautii]